jgi:hypothetical protein
MISCIEFIPSYNELFRFLDAEGGRAAVEHFWAWYTDRCLAGMTELVKKHGVRGCWLHWNQTLADEAADCTLEYDDEKDEFRIAMHHCPSKGMLLESASYYPVYPDYCQHCGVVYKRVLESLGYQYEIDLSHVNRATCAITVRKRGT